jgi:hypothetical protein
MKIRIMLTAPSRPPFTILPQLGISLRIFSYCLLEIFSNLGTE